MRIMKLSSNSKRKRSQRCKIAHTFENFVFVELNKETKFERKAFCAAYLLHSRFDYSFSVITSLVIAGPCDYACLLCVCSCIYVCCPCCKNRCEGIVQFCLRVSVFRCGCAWLRSPCACRSMSASSLSRTQTLNGEQSGRDVQRQ